jgi:hypothetical protein
MTGRWRKYGLWALVSTMAMVCLAVFGTLGVLAIDQRFAIMRPDLEVEIVSLSAVATEAGGGPISSTWTARIASGEAVPFTFAGDPPLRPGNRLRVRYREGRLTGQKAVVQYELLSLK